MSRPRFTSRGGAWLALASTLLTLVVSEAALRVLSDDRHYVWPPNLERPLNPRSDILPGVEGPSMFATNDLGMRGASFSEASDYRILTVGGSTTECYFLDQDEAWPHLLDLALDRATGRDISVGNVGRSGHNSRHHALQVAYLLDQHPRVSMVILMVGLNDLLLRLRRDDTFRPLEAEPREYSHELVRRAFAQGPGRYAWEPAYKRTEIWQLLRRTKQGVVARDQVGFQDDAGLYVRTARRERRAADSLIEELPDLTESLADYERRLREIVALSEERGVLPVLVTQPTMWLPELDRERSSLLWFGRRGDTDEFYAVRALAAGISLYNDRLKQVCAESDAMCVDLAAALPKDTTMFYDDAHFNESGARAVARELAEAILAALTRR